MSITIDNLTLTEAEAITLRDKLNAKLPPEKKYRTVLVRAVDIAEQGGLEWALTWIRSHVRPTDLDIGCRAHFELRRAASQ